MSMARPCQCNSKCLGSWNFGVGFRISTASEFCSGNPGVNGIATAAATTGRGWQGKGSVAGADSCIMYLYSYNPKR